jgi:hypothetical protein
MNGNKLAVESKKDISGLMEIATKIWIYDSLRAVLR